MWVKVDDWHQAGSRHQNFLNHKWVNFFKLLLLLLFLMMTDILLKAAHQYKRNILDGY